MNQRELWRLESRKVFPVGNRLRQQLSYASFLAVDLIPVIFSNHFVTLELLVQVMPSIYMEGRSCCCCCSRPNQQIKVVHCRPCRWWRPWGWQPADGDGQEEKKTAWATSPWHGSPWRAGPVPARIWPPAAMDLPLLSSPDAGCAPPAPPPQGGPGQRLQEIINMLKGQFPLI